MPDFNDLLLPFTLPFMQYAMLIAVLVAIPAALLSCFLVLKGWSLVGDGTAHAVLPGVVLSYIVGIPFAIGAFLAGMFFAVSTGFVRENSRIKQDTVMGVVYSGMFGLGIVMYTKIRSGVHLDHILFGDVLGISGQDLIESSLISGLVILVIAAKWRDLLLHSFDIVQARAVGLNVRLLHYGLLVLISLTIVSALKAVGLILSIAIMITPGATAYLLTKRFHKMMILAVIIATASAFLGVYASFYLDSAPAPTIVLFMSAIFAIALISQRKPPQAK